MGSPASPSHRRRQRQHLTGILLIALVLGAVAALFVLRWQTAQQHVALDPVRHCPVEGGPRGYLAVLFDVSDPLLRVQPKALRKELLDLEATLPVHHQVEIFVIRTSDAADLPKPEFDLCKPPAWSPGDSPWTRNPGQVQRAWEEGYRRPLEEALDGAMKAPPTADSPLMELIQAAAVTAFPGHADPAPRRLVIASDFLQHTEDYSHYGAGPPRFEDFVGTPAAGKVKADLSQFDVVMLYLRRDGQEHIQTPAHLEFWKRFFTWSGIEAGRLRIVPIEG